MSTRIHQPRTPALAPAVAAAVAAALAAALAACDRDAPARPAAAAPSVATAPAPAAVPTAPAAPVSVLGWDMAAGTALVVPGPADDALLVVPGAADSAGVDTARAAAGPALPAEAVLLDAGGMVGRARLAPAGGGTCAGWARVRVGPAGGADVAPAWTVGLVAPAGGGPAAIPLEPLHERPGADSAALAAALTRLAAALPSAPGVRPSTQAALRGVPFRVVSVRGFAPDSATRAVVATLTRTVNQEAAPVADLLLLVAERAEGGAPDGWRVGFAERATGLEEELPSTAVLAAVRLRAGTDAGAGSLRGGPRAALVTAREGEDGTRYGLLERVGPGAWRSRWTSVRTAPGCGRPAPAE